MVYAPSSEPTVIANEIWVGHDVFDNWAERDLILRLVADLRERGIGVLMLANFLTRQNGTQIDLLAHTSYRTALIEIKSWDRRKPIVGGVNGDWIVGEEGGPQDERSSPLRQLHRQSFAVSDAMHASESPRSSTQYFRDFTPVLAFDPVIPFESKIDTRGLGFMRVVGYDELVDLLCTPGRCVRWSPGAWDRFLDSLGLKPITEAELRVLRRPGAPLLVRDASGERPMATVSLAQPPPPSGSSPPPPRPSAASVKPVRTQRRSQRKAVVVLTMLVVAVWALVAQTVDRNTTDQIESPPTLVPPAMTDEPDSAVTQDPRFELGPGAVPIEALQSEEDEE